MYRKTNVGLVGLLDMAVGGAAMVVGLAMGIPGIVLIANSGEKKNIADEAKLAPPPTARAFTVPLFSATF